MCDVCVCLCVSRLLDHVKTYLLQESQVPRRLFVRSVCVVRRCGVLVFVCDCVRCLLLTFLAFSKGVGAKEGLYPTLTKVLMGF